MFGGVFTPVESAAVSVVYSLFVSAVIYREKSLRKLWSTIGGSAATTAQVMIILFAAFLVWYLTSTGIAVSITSSILSLSTDPVWLFVLINIAVLTAGMFLDAAFRSEFVRRQQPGWRDLRAGS